MDPYEKYREFFMFDFEKFSDLEQIDSMKSLNLLQKRLIFRKGDEDANIFGREDVFSFSLKKNNFNPNNKNVIIICTRDNSNLLNFTLNKLINSSRACQCDILIVDDRSIDDSVLKVSEKYEASCLRITNTSDIFNYSMLNNIAVKIADYFNKEYCVFWNVDMWVPNDNTLSRLINKHFENEATLSGTRLLYAKLQDYMELFPHLNHICGNYSDLAETIQHGGVVFNNLPSALGEHLWRYVPANHKIACMDSFMYAVTGAFWMIATKDFIENGGLNPSLVDVCQDIDFCLKLIETNKTICYIGSEFLYHAESILQQYFNEYNRSHVSDVNIYSWIWEPKIYKLLNWQKTLPSEA